MLGDKVVASPLASAFLLAVLIGCGAEAPVPTDTTVAEEILRSAIDLLPRGSRVSLVRLTVDDQHAEAAVPGHGALAITVTMGNGDHDIRIEMSSPNHLLYEYFDTWHIESGTTDREVTLRDVDPEVQANFRVRSVNGNEVTVDAGRSTSKHLVDSVLVFDWSWGDQLHTMVIGDTVATHTYAQPGNYNIGLVVSDGYDSDTESRGPFAVGLSSITLVVPNGGESWPIGSFRSVEWNSVNVAANEDVQITLSTDGGVTWASIATTPNDGTHLVEVPPAPTSTARLRVQRATNLLVSDLSDDDFIILQTAVTDIPVDSTFVAHLFASGPVGGGLVGLQTAFSWPTSWTLVQSRWNCAAVQIAQMPAQPGGPLAGTLRLAFQCITVPRVVYIGWMKFVAAGPGCLSQIESSFPGGTHALDCQMVEHKIAADCRGSICAETVGINTCACEAQGSMLLLHAVISRDGACLAIPPCE